jgi:hypothetical protein
VTCFDTNTYLGSQHQNRQLWPCLQLQAIKKIRIDYDSNLRSSAHESHTQAHEIHLILQLDRKFVVPKYINNTRFVEIRRLCNRKTKPYDLYLELVLFIGFIFISYVQDVHKVRSTFENDLFS